MAELEILEALVSFFCPTSDAASACREFISNHSQVLPPIGPLFYFLLFPIVFTILFIYILSSTILHGGNLTKGMRLLIGISVFIFIIISGWYPIMLVLSEFWFIMVIVLFGAWYFFRKHWGEETKASKGGGVMPGLGGGMAGLGGELVKRGITRATGKERRLEKEVNLKLKDLREIKNSIHDNEAGAWRAYSDVKNSAWSIINEFKDVTSVYGIPIGGGYEKKIAEMENILNELERKKPKNI
jgi:hypothetical protein